jgi:plasmanylethanolamine desaturase
MTKHPETSYGSTQRVLEIAGIAAFGFMMVWNTHCIVQLSPSGWPTIAWVCAAGFASWLFADFMSGLVHWAADNWGQESWPVLGAGFIRPFREHHVLPRALCDHDWIELNGNNCIVCVPMLTIPYFWDAANFNTSSLFWQSFIVGTAFWTLGTNQFHAWAHSESPPLFARILQRVGIILSVPHHDVHHQPPHAGNYCITSGKMNPVLRRVRFFESCEWLITALSGVQPVHKEIAADLAASRSSQATQQAA